MRWIPCPADRCHQRRQHRLERGERGGRAEGARSAAAPVGDALGRGGDVGKAEPAKLLAQPFGVERHLLPWITDERIELRTDGADVGREAGDQRGGVGEARESRDCI